MAKFEIHDAKNDEYYWALIADNGETLCHSETFTSKQGCLNGIKIVKREAPNASVQDHTKSAKLR